MFNSVKRKWTLPIFTKTSLYAQHLATLKDEDFYTINDLPLNPKHKKISLGTKLVHLFANDKRFDNLADAIDLKRAGKINQLDKLRDSIHYLNYLPTRYKVRVEECFIQTQAGSMRVQVYMPRVKRKKIPVLLYIHGGGFVFGNELVGDSFCRKVAYRNEAIVVNINNRLSPEFTFPQPLEDCYDALLYCYEQAESWGADKDLIFVSGDSAGGNLSAALNIYSEQKKGPHIAGLLLFYPALDFTQEDTTTLKLFSTGYGLSEKCAKSCAYAYVAGDEALAYNSLVSPILANAILFPPSFIACAQFDILRNDGFRFSKKLKSAGIPTRYICIEGTFHCFISYEYTRAFEIASDNAIEFLRRIAQKKYN